MCMQYTNLPQAAATDSPAHPSRPLALSMACRAWMSAPHGSAPGDRWQGHGWHCIGWHSTAWYGTAWDGTALNGIAWNARTTGPMPFGDDGRAQRGRYALSKHRRAHICAYRDRAAAATDGPPGGGGRSINFWRQHFWARPTPSQHGLAFDSGDLRPCLVGRTCVCARCG
jgi:hypothetical protein